MRLTNEVAEFIRLNCERMSFRQMAAALEKCEQTISLYVDHLENTGIIPKDARKQAIYNAIRENQHKLFAHKIGKLVNCSENTIYRYAQKIGVRLTKLESTLKVEKVKENTDGMFNYKERKNWLI